MSLSSERFRTGSFGLDVITGGGWKRGAINEIWGPTGSGKTMLAKQTLQHRHIHDKAAIWVDTGPETKLGATDPNLLVARPRSAEQAFQTLELSAEHGVSLAIVDDAAHLVRQIELDDPDYEPDSHREFKLELNRLKVALAATGMTCIFLSQPRDKMRSPIRGTGISEKSAERISLAIEKRPHSGETYIRATHKKSGDTTAYWVVPGKGIDRVRELIYYGLREDVIWQQGPRYIWDGWSFNGMAELQSYLKEWEHARSLERLLRRRLGVPK